MRRFLILLLLWLAQAVLLADTATNFTTTTVTVTNIAETGDTITINGMTRTWTNATTTTTILTNLAGVNQTATNLWRALSLNRPSSPYLLVTMTATNAIKLQGTAASVTVTGEWATVTSTSQLVTNRYGLILPWDTLPAAERTNIASETVYGLQYSTNAIPVGASAVSNLLALTGSATQTVTAPKIFTGTNVLQGMTLVTNAAIWQLTNASGYLGSVTNGTWTNGTALKLTVTNLYPYGTGTNSVAIGVSATASSNSTTAVGNEAAATGRSATALGWFATATGSNSLALGASTEASSTNSIAIGRNASSTATDGIALGVNAAATHTNSIAVGNGSATTMSNQIVLGSSTHRVTIAGLLEASTATNTVLAGTNIIWDTTYLAGTSSSLANGNNAGVPTAGRSYWRMSGPTAAYALCGMTNGYDGRFLILQLDAAGYTVTIANQSGVEPTAANRIITGTGGDITSTNQSQIVSFIYDGNASRWRVVSIR